MHHIPVPWRMGWFNRQGQFVAKTPITGPNMSLPAMMLWYSEHAFPNGEKKARGKDSKPGGRSNEGGDRCRNAGIYRSKRRKTGKWCNSRAEYVTGGFYLGYNPVLELNVDFVPEVFHGKNRFCYRLSLIDIVIRYDKWLPVFEICRYDDIIWMWSVVTISDCPGVTPSFPGTTTPLTVTTKSDTVLISEPPILVTTILFVPCFCTDIGIFGIEWKDTADSLPWSVCGELLFTGAFGRSPGGGRMNTK